MPDVTLTNSEWYVLDCLWEHSPLTVMELVERLSQKVGWAKSTTITTLRRMEEKGLVNRKVYAEVPPRVEYSLTDLGRSLKPILDAMWDWGEGYKAQNS